MASRPWISPQDVRDYSENTSIQTRSDKRLEMDIARAEQYIISYTHNKFEDVVEVPSSVKTAAILLAESYAKEAVLASKTVKSESFDDYSYTLSDAVNKPNGLELAALLDEFVRADGRKNINMKMRKL